jgi:hypothetical protein
MLCGAAGATVGQRVSISGANAVVNAGADDDELGYVVGKALETAVNTDTFLVMVGK